MTTLGGDILDIIFDIIMPDVSRWILHHSVIHLSHLELEAGLLYVKAIICRTSN